MKHAFALASLVFALVFAGTAFAAGQTPEQFLRAIYAEYTAPPPANGLVEEDNVKTRRLYEADLAELIIADYRKMQDMPGEPVLEFDPLLNAQDVDIKGPIGVTMKNQTADRAIAAVTFSNSGRKQVLTFSLIKAGATWKIRDIDWNGRRSLRALLSHH